MGRYQKPMDLASAHRDFSRICKGGGNTGSLPYSKLKAKGPGEDIFQVLRTFLNRHPETSGAQVASQQGLGSYLVFSRVVLLELATPEFPATCGGWGRL